MTGPSQKFRILVGLDLSAGSVEAAELTAEIASALNAEVCGLFVEEEELLRLADHPLVREVGTWSTVDRVIDTRQLERRMRAQGCRARDLLARLADRRGLAWSFQVARGLAPVAIREASGAVDIVTLGRVGWSPGERRRLGGTARDLLIHAEQPVMITGARAASGAPIVVCCGDSPAGERAVKIAHELAGRLGVPLSVNLIGNAAGRESELLRRLEELAAGSKLAIGVTVVEDSDLPSLARSIAPSRLIILARGEDLDGPALATLVAELSSPVLVIN